MTTLMQMPDGRLIRACFFVFVLQLSFAFFCARVGQRRMQRERERDDRRRLFFLFVMKRVWGGFSAPFLFLSLSLSFRTCETESSSASSSFAHRFSTRTNVHNTHTHNSSENLFLLFSTRAF